MNKQAAHWIQTVRRFVCAEPCVTKPTSPQEPTSKVHRCMSAEGPDADALPVWCS